MGRPRRITAGGVVHHVLNRANRRARIFHKPRDYDAFLKVLMEGLERISCRVLGLCLMPNHWHLVPWPHEDGDMSRLMAWVSNTHVKRYRNSAPAGIAADPTAKPAGSRRRPSAWASN